MRDMDDALVNDDEPQSPLADAPDACAAGPSISLPAGKNADSCGLIPADEDILVEVSASGYQTWRMETQPGATHANAIRLRSEDTKEFTIRLHPLSTP
jgi:hypothetical protein